MIRRNLDCLQNYFPPSETESDSEDTVSPEIFLMLAQSDLFIFSKKFVTC